jgi:hypothetical protein
MLLLENAVEIASQLEAIQLQAKHGIFRGGSATITKSVAKLALILNL